MKVSELPAVEMPQGLIGDINVLCEPFLQKGAALVFANVIFVRSMDDNIVEIFDHRPLWAFEKPIPWSWMAL